MIFWLTATIGAVAAGYSMWQASAYGRRLLKQPRLLPVLPPVAINDHHAIEAKAQVIAEANLLGGIEKRRLRDGREMHVLCAGWRNFREPWARDFGFASLGLMDLGAHQTVRETLEVFLTHQRLSGQFAVKIHSTSVLDRYLHSLFSREQPIVAPLKPKYVTAHNTISLDGNALLVMAALNYIRRAGDHDFARRYWPQLARAITWVDSHAHPTDGLIHQDPFADWADSVARKGRVLYSNVVFWKAMHDMAETAATFGTDGEASRFRARAAAIKAAINTHLWRPNLGYFATSDEFQMLSSSGNLLAIAWDLATPAQAAAILDKMDEFDMARPVPTQVTHQPYPTEFIAIENRLAGIGHYHTSAAWLWLGAWHVVALAHTGRLAAAEDVLRRLSGVIVRDGVVHEVYDPGGHFLSTAWYTSEAPLTWSAGMVVYAFHEYRRHLAQARQSQAI